MENTCLACARKKKSTHSGSYRTNAYPVSLCARAFIFFFCAKPVFSPGFMPHKNTCTGIPAKIPNKNPCYLEARNTCQGSSKYVVGGTFTGTGVTEVLCFCNVASSATTDFERRRPKKLLPLSLGDRNETVGVACRRSCTARRCGL